MGHHAIRMGCGRYPLPDGEPHRKILPYKAAGYGRWIQTLGRGELVYGHTRQFPESERPGRSSRHPLYSPRADLRRRALWGHIGFDECVAEREWSAAEVGALGAAAGTLGAAIRRRRTEEQLRGSEERYRAVIEQATDGIYLLDAETRRFVETNPSFRRCLATGRKKSGRWISTTSSPIRARTWTPP